MTAEIFNMRDYQSKKAKTLTEAELNGMAVEIVNVALADAFHGEPVQGERLVSFINQLNESLPDPA